MQAAKSEAYLLDTPGPTGSFLTMGLGIGVIRADVVSATISRIVAMTAMLGLVACWAPAKRDTSRPDDLQGSDRGPANAREAFEITIPVGCELENSPSQMDFVTFYVTCSGVTYVEIYVGNAADQTRPRSRLIKTAHSWPRQVQVWSAKVSTDQARADAIGVSVRLRRQ